MGIFILGGGGVEKNSTIRAPPQVNHGNKDMERGGKGFCLAGGNPGMWRGWCLL